MSGPSVALSEVIAEARPGFASGSDLTDGVAQLRMNNLTREGKLDWSKIRRVEPPKKVEHLLLEPGDVLFNATNSPELVGKTAFFNGFEEPITFSNHFLRLRPEKERLDGRYLAHWMQKQFASGRFARMCKQWVNQATVSKDLLLSLAIPLPPLDEQRRIAAILDQAEELRAKRRAAIDLLDQLPQLTFLEMFGDPATNPMDWPKMPLCKLANTRLGKMLDKKKQSTETPLPYLGNANVQWFRFDLRNVQRMTFNDKERSILRLAPGDVLICEGGEPGRCAVWAGELQECYFQKAIHRARVDESKVLPQFLAHCLFNLAIRGGLKDYVTVATIAHLTGEKLATLPFPLPPIDVQRSFAVRVEAIQRAKAVHQSALAELDTLFVSLQSRAFDPSPAVAQVASSR